MKKMFFRSLAVVAIAAVACYNVYQSNSVMNRLSDLALANVEALAVGDVITGKCPEPYDVYDHQFGFTQRTGTYIVNSSGEINIMGNKIKVGSVSAGTNITVTYEIGNCETYSPGNCCPYKRIGEINILGL